MKLIPSSYLLGMSLFKGVADIPYLGFFWLLHDPSGVRNLSSEHSGWGGQFSIRAVLLVSAFARYPA